MQPNSSVTENCGFEEMMSHTGDAIAISCERYVSFPNMHHTDINFQLGNEKKTPLISEGEPASVRSTDERSRSSITPIRRMVKDYCSSTPMQSTCIPQLDHNISIAHSSPSIDDVSAKFPNCRAYVGDQDSSPPQKSECQANMKLQMNIKGGKESIPSLHPVPSIQHSIDVKASSKSFKMGSRKSLQSVMNTQIFDRNTHISCSEDRDQGNSTIRSLGLYNQKIASQENSMGGSLYLLVDAIELLEGLQHHRTIGIEIQERVPVQVLPKNMLRRFKNSLGKPSLQDHQCLIRDHGLESVKVLPFNTVSEPGDVQHSFSSISEVCEIGQGTTSGTRSKRGRLQALPSKYSDSVLQPWKKVSRKVPTCNCS